MQPTGVEYHIWHLLLAVRNKVIIMIKRLTLFFIFVCFFTYAPRVLAACPTSNSTTNITIGNNTNCSLSVGTTYLDNASNTESSTTNSSVLTLSGGNGAPAALTIPNGAILKVGSISIGAYSTVTIQNGGIINPGPTTAYWVADGDADGWAASFTTYTATAAGRRRLGLMNSTTVVDCNDAAYSTSNSCGTAATVTGSGNDGAVTFSVNTNINTVNTITGRSCADGGDAVNYSVTGISGAVITLSTTPSAGCLAAGNEVMLINLQGTTSNFTNVGNYETFLISSISTNTITLDATPSLYYGNGASDNTNIGTATSNQRVMLQRVPNYTTVTINGGVTVTGSAWNGVKGGVVAFKATGTVTVTGNISVAQLGYRAAGQANDTGQGGGGGESICGPATGPSASGTSGAAGSGDYSATGGSGTCGGGGGGGSTAGSGSGSSGGAGGGGGSTGMGGGGGGGYGTAGAGSSGWSLVGGSGGTNSSGNGTSDGGAGGGGTYGAANLSKLFFGAAGGGGSSSSINSGQHSWGGVGGTGAGIVYISAATVNVSGSISANGGNGNVGSGYVCGGGGGGAGGSIYIYATDSTSLGNKLVTATAGAAAGSGCGANGRSGAAGGAGRIKVYAASTLGGYTNPQFDSTCMSWPDADADGYGNLSSGVYNCVTPVGNITTNGDCYDSNANAKPGQASCFTTSRGDGSFDYNCDGSQSLCSPVYSSACSPVTYCTSCNKSGSCTGTVGAYLTASYSCGQSGCVWGVNTTNCWGIGNCASGPWACHYDLSASGTQSCQ